jgi:hypothetical protein
MPAIGASGVLGVARETVSGTYLAPEKFVPFMSESLGYVQDTVWRRPIRNSSGLIGAVPGNARVEGEISMEAFDDVIPYFMAAARATLVKSGAGPYVYTYTPSAAAVPVKTLSIAIRRNAEVMAYVGCVVSSFTFTVGSDGTLMFNVKIVGNNEATQSALTLVWPTTVPYGAGMYTVEIPTATQVFDTDTFEFNVEDNAEAQYRLKSAGARGAQFVKFGESAASIKVERDFETRSDYDTFKALTASSITFKANNGASSIINITCPVAIKDTYEVSIPSQGDLVRASVTYQAAINATGEHYTLAVTSAVNIT